MNESYKIRSMSGCQHLLIHTIHCCAREDSQLRFQELGIPTGSVGKCLSVVDEICSYLPLTVISGRRFWKRVRRGGGRREIEREQNRLDFLILQNKFERLSKTVTESISWYIIWDLSSISQWILKAVGKPWLCTFLFLLILIFSCVFKIYCYGNL